MKKLGLFFILMEIFIWCGFSQSLTLQKICSGLAKNPVTTGDFVQIKTINANGRQLKSSGNFIISPYGIMWKTLKPFPSSLVVTESAMIQTAANGKQSVMNGADNQIFQNIASTLRSVFAGDSAELNKHFTVEFGDEGLGEGKNPLQGGQNATEGAIAAGGEPVWTIILTPKDATIASVMKSLVLSGRGGVENAGPGVKAADDKAGGGGKNAGPGEAIGVGTQITLQSLELLETSNNKIRYEFSNQKYPKELTEDEKANFTVK